LFDTVKKTPLRQIAAHVKPAPVPVYCVAWSPDGKQVVSGGMDQALRLWDAGSGNLVREFAAYKEKDFEKGHRDAVFGVAFSPDGKTIASGSSDRTVKLWNVADGKVVRELVNPEYKPAPGNPPEAHPGWVYSLRFTPDGKHLVSVGQAPRNHGHLAVWNVADGKLLSARSLPLGAFYGVAVAPDGKALALAPGPHGEDGNPAYLVKMPGQ
jgi:WD40 repeat protein